LQHDTFEMNLATVMGAGERPVLGTAGREDAPKEHAVGEQILNNRPTLQLW